jgi:hypothetical protein
MPLFTLEVQTRTDWNDHQGCSAVSSMGSRPCFLLDRTLKSGILEGEGSGALSSLKERFVRSSCIPALEKEARFFPPLSSLNSLRGVHIIKSQRRHYLTLEQSHKYRVVLRPQLVTHLPREPKTNSIPYINLPDQEPASLRSPPSIIHNHHR